MMRCLRPLIAVPLLFALPGVAVAQQMPSGSTGPIEVAGVQPLICGAAFDQTSAAVNLVESTSQSVGITLQCNARFRLVARSANGELRHQGQYVAGNPRTFVPYDVVWPANLVDDNSAAIAPAFTAPGTQWAGTLSASSAPTRQVQRGDMVIRWRSATDVLAGSYVDTFYLDIVAN
jgi:hypothetical protein